MSEYYISYEQKVPWNGSVFNANEYRKAINAFYSKVDLVNPNVKTADDAPMPTISVRDLSPDAKFPNELGFGLTGKFSDTKKDELTGLPRVFVTLSGDIKVPRPTTSGKTLSVTIASANKSLVADGTTPAIAFNKAFKQLRESILQTLADQIGGRGIKIERQDAFTDPEPALVGPPTQTISGVTNKAPVVDNPNIKLPTQEVKGLDANAAQQAASKATSQVQSSATSAVSSVGNLTSQAQSAVSQAQGSVGNLTSQAQSAVSQAQGSVGNLTSQAQSAVGNVQQSAGGILNNLSSGVKGALGGGALGAGIGALAGGGKAALIGAGAGVLAGGIAGSVVDKLNPKGIKVDGLGKDWSPDKFSPESIAGNDKIIDAKTGVISSTSKLAKSVGGLIGKAQGAASGVLGAAGSVVGGVTGAAGSVVGGVTGAAGSVVGGVTGAVGGALSKIPLVGGVAGGLVSGVGGAAGSLVSGVGGAAGGLVSGVGGAAGNLVSGVGGAPDVGSMGGLVGGALAGAGLGAGIGGLVSGAKGALIGGGAGGALGAAAAKLSSIKKNMPKLKIPKPPSTPRIKTIKIPRPDSTKGAEQLLNLSKSKLGAIKTNVGSQITANIDTNKLNSYGGFG